MQLFIKKCLYCKEKRNTKRVLCFPFVMVNFVFLVESREPSKKKNDGETGKMIQLLNRGQGEHGRDG